MGSNGFVLGIGDETQIDEDKLNALSDILNHPPATLHYSVMALEKNPAASASFLVPGVHYLTGDNLRLVATLSKKKRAMLGGKVIVYVD